MSDTSKNQPTILKLRGSWSPIGFIEVRFCTLYKSILKPPTATGHCHVEVQYPFSTDIEEGGIPPDGSQEILVDFDPGYKAEAKRTICFWLRFFGEKGECLMVCLFFCLRCLFFNVFLMFVAVGLDYFSSVSWSCLVRFSR